MAAAPTPPIARCKACAAAYGSRAPCLPDRGIHGSLIMPDPMHKSSERVSFLFEPQGGKVDEDIVWRRSSFGSPFVGDTTSTRRRRRGAACRTGPLSDGAGILHGQRSELRP